MLWHICEKMSITRVFPSPVSLFLSLEFHRIKIAVSPGTVMETIKLELKD